MVGGEGGGVKYFKGRSDADEPPPSLGDSVQVAPNPFAAQTTLTFALDEAARVRLSVYDLLGRRVSVLVNRQLGPGEHTARFRGPGRASGVYLYVLSVDGRIRTRGRMTRVR
ncbi:MAG: hypothetical protein BRD34_03430 [Bacteroidetes bacterium QH_6_64_77]|nr:MAG: hypothetical protein BRD34_03430 [Bacteroidetes bacterium QH_6_64_77]